MANPFVFWWGWGGCVVRIPGASQVLIVRNYTAHLRIDNLGIAHVFAKGHCKSPPINRVLANAFAHEVRGAIAWVPTKGQVADGPTSEALPSCVFSEKDNWLFIRPTWFAGGKGAAADVSP